MGIENLMLGGITLQKGTIPDSSPVVSYEKIMKAGNDGKEKKSEGDIGCLPFTRENRLVHSLNKWSAKTLIENSEGVGMFHYENLLGVPGTGLSSHIYSPKMANSKW